MEAEEELIICRCEEVSRKTIEEAVAEGAATLDGIKRATRAGMGFCQGRSCRQLVARIISARTGKPLEAIEPATCRHPSRPIKLNLLAEEGEAMIRSGSVK